MSGVTGEAPSRCPWGEKMYRLFVVEDDSGIAEAVESLGKTWGLEVKICGDFSNVKAEFAAFSPHIVLMDIGLPFYDGFYWCREIRALSKVPIIFISSASDNMNIIMAVNMGADDFVVKPFDGRVLMAKVQALLRRTYDFSDTACLVEHKGAVLNKDDGSLSFNGQKLSLSKNEYRIMLCLMENKGKVVSRERLMEKLWETEQFVDENTLTVNVNRLRKKLCAVGLEDFITTKFRQGYIVE